ncbi:helix-turn-helix transcriptional regulator [Salinarimonas sp. NSM]|uniref:helix-turn-helix transcriptional regulator n=1 Tax=Salinarimonas sp. NSM TaxID=3458003 RepID=UPI0040374D48
MTETDDTMLTIDEAATRLGMHRATVFRRINEGKLAVARDGRWVRIRLGEIRRYVAAQTKASHSMAS